jgi:hypothetical protein
VRFALERQPGVGPGRRWSESSSGAWRGDGLDGHGRIDDAITHHVTIQDVTPSDAVNSINCS